MNNAYGNPYIVAADASQIERSQFLRRTYMHLAGAILAFIAIEAAILGSPLKDTLNSLMLGGQFNWLVVLGLFMGASWLAQKWADSGTSKAMQYAGLGLYVLAQAVIFVPILSIAIFKLNQPDIVAMAGLLTLGLFFGLTTVVVLTKKDFSFLRGVLAVGGFVALGLIVASILFGFNLGTIFSAAMVAFAGAAILYHTSNVFYRYSTDQYVAASLALFASVALMFFYILRILMGRR